MSFIRTVLGDVDRAVVGVTLPHEHILCDSVKDLGRQTVPLGAPDLWDVELDETNRDVIDRFIVNNRDNLVMSDLLTAVQEVGAFRSAGGSCIVDTTTRGMGPDWPGLAEVSRRSGVHIVCGAGHYVGASHPDHLAGDSSRLHEDLLRTVMEGSRGIRPGIIGEIGMSWPPTASELTVLDAAMAVSRETGLALVIHPGRHEESPSRLADRVEQSGCDPSRVVFCHLDTRLHHRDQFLELADRGFWLEFDQFGINGGYLPYFPDREMPGDAWRVSMIEQLAKAGFADQILVSHDIAVKSRLRRFGGHGYDHVAASAEAWFGEELRHQLMVENPRNMLSIRRDDLRKQSVATIERGAK